VIRRDGIVGRRSGLRDEERRAGPGLRIGGGNAVDRAISESTLKGWQPEGSKYLTKSGFLLIPFVRW